MSTDGGATRTGSHDRTNETATLTEAETIAALQKTNEEQATLNSSLTQELETLRAQLKGKEVRGAARRKTSNPKTLTFDSQDDETEEGEDEEEERTPERDETESESEGSPPRLPKKKHNRGVKGAPPTKPIHIDLENPTSSDITPETLAAILRNIELGTNDPVASDPTGALSETVRRLMLEKRTPPSTSTQKKNQPSRGAGISRRSSRNKDRNSSQDELAEIRARLEKSDSEAKLLRSQIHKALSSAPEIAQMCEESEHTPFSTRILNTRMSDPGKLSIQKYDGSTNPKDHINAFRVGLSRAPFGNSEEKDAGFCLLFAEYLKGAALEWFLNLEPNSIDNFQQLTALFLKQYSMFIEKSATVVNLWNMRQGEDESLRSYMDRFKATMSKAGTINDEIAIDSLKKGLQLSSDFRKELVFNAPKSISDAIHRSVVFVTEEEDMKVLTALRSSSKATIKPQPNPSTVQQPSNQQQSDFHPNHLTNRRGKKGYVHHEGPSFSGAHNCASWNPHNGFKR